MKRAHLLSAFTFILYILVNILTLTRFPFVHSDEVWLAGLSRTIYNAKTFVVTEPFFKLFPRQPHTIKSFFHAIQGAYFSFFGYSITSARMISLGVTLILLIIIYTHFTNRLKAELKAYSPPVSKIYKLVPLLSTLATALSVQFIYASHFARQEAFILLILVAAYLYFDWITFKGTYSLFHAAVLSLITGTAIGFHPNSFLIACVVGSLALYNLLKHKGNSFRESLVFIGAYIGLTGLIASLYIWMSILWNRQFLRDYNTFADSLGVTSSLVDKLKTFPLFIYKLYEQISGTYYTPNIRLEMFFFSGLCLVSLALYFFHHIRSLKSIGGAPFTRMQNSLLRPLWAIGGLTAGLILIGRYNATSIVFYLPFISFMGFNIFLYLLQCKNLSPLLLKVFTAGILIISFGMGFNAIRSVKDHQMEPYKAYINEIVSALDMESDANREGTSPSSKVLMNLNGGFAFSPDRFLDYRDLAYLKKNSMTTEDYVKTYNVDYIILSEEMDYIYRNQDRWDILYGQMDYYPDLIDLIERQFTLIHSFESPRYGMRIPLYNDGYPWTVKIYKRNL